MATELDPIVGQWYRHLDKGRMFVVTASDEVQGIVEIQHYDGDLEEIEANTWGDLDLELAPAPEDWTGPVDDVEPDDLGYSETGMTPRDWSAPFQENYPSTVEDWEDVTPAVEEEWAEADTVMLFGPEAEP